MRKRDSDRANREMSQLASLDDYIAEIEGWDCGGYVKIDRTAGSACKVTGIEVYYDDRFCDRHLQSLLLFQSACESLEELHIGESSVTDEGLAALVAFPSLNDVNFSERESRIKGCHGSGSYHGSNHSSWPRPTWATKVLPISQDCRNSRYSISPRRNSRTGVARFWGDFGVLNTYIYRTAAFPMLVSANS